MHKRHGAEREGGNGMKLEQNGTDQNTHGEIHRRAGSGLQSSGSGLRLRARAFSGFI